MIGDLADTKVDLSKLMKPKHQRITDYKWYVEILFNNGKYTYGQLECEYSNSLDVAKAFFSGNSNVYNSMSGVHEYEKAQVFYKLQDVSCFKIQEKPFCSRE